MHIACDESGAEGERLIDATTDVFAHAGVRFDIADAAAAMAAIRRRAPTPAVEFKANHILRQKNRKALAWMLGPSGPLAGHAHVHLTDKAFFVVGKVVDLLLGESGDALYREGRTADPELWHAFLVSSNNLMRAHNRRGVQTSVDSFFSTVELLRVATHNDVLARLLDARSRVDELRAHLLDRARILPPLDPLIPAIVRAVEYWGEGVRPVTIVHDRQKTLSPDRIVQLKTLCSGMLTDIVQVAARDDPRVQIADVLAGAARKIASDELNGRGDPQLTELLQPFVLGIA